MNKAICFFSIVPFILAAQAWLAPCSFINSHSTYYFSVPFILFPINLLLLIFIISTFFIKKLKLKIRYPIVYLVLLILQYPAAAIAIIRAGSCA